MNQGFTILELLVASAISIGILSIVIVNIAHSSSLSGKLVSQQQSLEALFHTVDTIKSDLSKCGMRMQEAAEKFSLEAFQPGEDGFAVQFGISSSVLMESAPGGAVDIETTGDDFARPRKKVLLYSIEKSVFEFNEIQSVSGNRVTLKKALNHTYPETSPLVIIKEVRLRFYSRTGQLKRRLDNGNFQPLMDNVTDFASTYFPESRSVLYRIEINNREQVRGYIFLNNLVKP